MRLIDTKLMLLIESVTVIILSIFLFTGCGYNRQIIDLNYKFDTAIIEGIGEVPISSWADFENSDMIQVTDTSGNVYLKHSSNVILMNKK